EGEFLYEYDCINAVAAYLAGRSGEQRWSSSEESSNASLPDAAADMRSSEGEVATLPGQEAAAPVRSRDELAACVERAVLAVAADKGVTRVEHEASFSELGLDSIEILELQAELERRLQLRLDSSFLYEHETVSEIADY